MTHMNQEREAARADVLVDLIRHGEPEGGPRYRGFNIDDPLSEKGWQQMWSAVESAHPWTHIVTSPLRRCRDFAEALGEKHQLPVTVQPNFKEVGFGDWEGKTKAELQQIDLDGFKAFYRDPINHRPEGAENLDAFRQRVATAYDEVIAVQGGQHLLIVAHAGVIRAIVAHVLSSGPESLYRMAVKNAGITRIRHGIQGGILEFLNV